MAYRIDTIIAHLLEVRVGFTYSSGTLESARAIVWELRSGPHAGFGECGVSTEASCPGIGLKSGEATRQKTLHELLEPWARPLKGQDPLRLEQLLPPMPPVLDWDVLVTREGLSIALYDLAGRICGAPVYALLGGARREQMPGMPVIHVGPPDVMLRRARMWLENGYRYLKIKLRGRLDEDVEAVRRIRAAAGPGISIQVDSNDGYKQVDDAERAIRALADQSIDIFEDMLDAPLPAIAELRRRTGARIMVDRQSSWPQVHDVVRFGAADVVNHHPNNQGGLFTALQIDAVALAAGLVTAVGSSGMFGIQDAAFEHLAAVIGTTRPCEDIGLTPYYSGPTRGEYAFDGDPTVVCGGPVIRNGTIHIPNDPGLGLTFDPAALRRMEIDQAEF